MYKNNFFYVSLITALVLLIFLFSFRAYMHYTVLKSHREYFRQPNPEIQSWMTIHSVARHFNISESALFQEMNVSATMSNRRLTIEGICKKNNLDCNEMLIRLNLLKK